MPRSGNSRRHRSGMRERVAPERERAVEIVGEDHDVVDRGGRARIGGWRGGARRCRRIVVLDDDRLHTPRALARQHDAPPPSDRARRRDRFAGSDRARLQSGCRERARRAVDVRRAERDREHTLGARSQVFSERRAQRPVAAGGGREQLDVAIREAEDHVSRPERGMRAAPGRRETEQVPVRGLGRREVAHRDHQMVDAVEERGRHVGSYPKQSLEARSTTQLDGTGRSRSAVLSGYAGTRSAACLTVRDASRRSATRRK